MEHGSHTPESPSDDLSFVGVDAIEALREQQSQAVSESNTQIFAETPWTDIIEKHDEIRQRLNSRAAERVDTAIETYLNDHLARDDNPALYDRLLGLLKQTSVTTMGSEKWYLGDTDDDGNHTKEETSGQALVRQTLDELRGMPETTPGTPPDPDSPEHQAALRTLAEARHNLAELSIQRRRMIGKRTKKARRLEAQYLTAQEAYQTAFQQVGVLTTAAWRTHTITDDELRAAVIHMVLDEKQEFSREELSVLEHEDDRRARFARWLSKRHNLIGFNVVSGAAIGYGARKLAKGAVLATIGVAAPVALGAGLAIRTARAVVGASVGNRVQQIRHLEAYAAEDQKQLKADAHAQLPLASGHEHFVDKGSQLLTSNLSHRIEKDRKANRNRVLLAMLVSGSAAVAAEVATDYIGSLGTPHTPSGAPTHPQTNPLPSAPPHHPGGHNGNGGPNHPHNNHNGGGKNGNHNNHGGAHEKHPRPGIVDGYHTHVQIDHGEGYQQSLTDLAAQKHIYLSNTQSWQLYEHLNDKFHGKFLTNNPSYRMNNPGEWGISRPGASTWNPAVIHEMNRWLEQNDIHHKLAKAAGKAGKKAFKSVPGARHVSA